MRRSLLFLLAFALLAGQAQAGLLGTTVTAEFDFPNLGTASGGRRASW